MGQAFYRIPTAIAIEKLDNQATFSGLIANAVFVSIVKERKTTTICRTRKE